MRENVTERRLREVGHEGGFVSFGQSVRAKPGARITKTESKVYDAVPVDGLHIGRISKALLYAPAIRHLAYTKPERAALIKLLKRGALRVERDTGTDEEYLVRAEHAPNPKRARAPSKTVDVSLPFSRPAAEQWLRARLIPFTHMRELSGGGVAFRIRRGYLNDFRRQRERNPRRQPKRTARGRRAGARKNPSRPPRGTALTIPSGVGEVKVSKLGGWVEQMKYQDKDDRKFYVHDFGDLQALMYLAESPFFGHCIVIASADDKPLWENA